MAYVTRRQVLSSSISTAALLVAHPLPLLAAPMQASGAALELPVRVLYYGADQPLPKQVELTAGPVSMIFEPDLAFLRYVRFGDREILPGVYSAVRDRNWNTISPRVSNLKIQTESDAFQVTFDVECKQNTIDFAWKGAIRGESNGSVIYSMTGTARSDFHKNRVGFCVLHPIRECAGQPCSVEKSDGTIERGAFPRYIAPNQPFMNMRAITHSVVPGLDAEVRFSGDIFEMEDQRNWTDASYKTYCTPLGLPFPVELKKGTTVTQSVAISLKGIVPSSSRVARNEAPFLELNVNAGQAKKLPGIGVELNAAGPALSGKERERLAALHLSHLRLDLALDNAAFPSLLKGAAAESAALNLPLEVAIFVTNDADRQLQALAAELKASRPSVARWLVFHRSEPSTTEHWVKLARQYLASYDPKAKIGAGTNAYFTELNRGRPSLSVLDFISYSINPQVHAFDNASLVETLAGQAYTVESAKAFAGNVPVVISPVTLRARFNPNATSAESAAPSGELPSQVDPRQMSLFGAGWTLGSIKHLATSGIESVTYYEATGWRGVMATAAGSPLPSKFPNLPNAVFPLYHVLADVGEFAGGEVILSQSSDPFKLEGITLRKGNRSRIVVANMSPQSRYVRIRNAGFGKRIRVLHLDEVSAARAMHSPEEFRGARPGLIETGGDVIEIALLPYAVARIDPAEAV